MGRDAYRLGKKIKSETAKILKISHGRKTHPRNPLKGIPGVF